MTGDDQFHPGDEPTMPHLPDRDNPIETHVELLPPSNDCPILVNGLRVPHLSAFEARQTMTLIVDERFAYDLPIEIADTVIGLVANVIAVERGYGSWPRTPGEHDQPKAPAFGPIHHAIDAPPEDGT